METKKEIRQRIRQVRSQIPKDVQRQYSLIIQKKLIEEDVFRCANEIFCYVSSKDEVRTDQIMLEAWKQGKKIAVPKVTAKGEMEFYYIQGLKELKIGHYGILEPTSSALANANHGLMIVPGICFDRNGRRIGYGGGYYDRYLSKHCPKYNVALAYSCQMTEVIQTEEHDISVDMIFTERERMKC